jgi:putative transcriptional regulator
MAHCRARDEPVAAGLAARLLAALALGAAAVAVWPAAAAEPPQPPFGGGPLAQVRDLAPGKLLVAAEALGDGNFAETLVLLLEYGSEGATGLVVNDRTEIPLSRVFGNLALGSGEAAPVYLGGPVSVSSVLALVRSPLAPPGTQHVVGDVHLIADREVLTARLVSGTDPASFRVYLGYAGWAPGQLDRETEAGAWHVFDADPEVVFDADPATAWQRLIRRTEWRMVTAPWVSRRPRG